MEPPPQFELRGRKIGAKDTEREATFLYVTAALDATSSVSPGSGFPLSSPLRRALPLAKLSWRTQQKRRARGSKVLRCGWGN